MKIDQQELNRVVNPKKFAPPPIPLDGAELKKVTKGTHLELKLKSNPGEETSPTYTVQVPILDGTETPIQVLHWKEQFERVLVGQGLNTGPPRYAMARRLMDGTAKDTFNSKAQELGNESVVHCTTAIKHTLRSILPMRAVPRQRRYMNRQCRKPRNMTTRVWLTKMQALNLKLGTMGEILHDTELEGAGAYDQTAVMLPADQLIDAACEGIPNSWKQQMHLHDFDPVDHSVDEFIAFCERLEQAEGEFGDKVSNGTDTKLKPKPKSGGKPSTTNKPKNTTHGGKRKYCKFPGHGYCMHTSEECRDLQKMKHSGQQDIRSYLQHKRRKYDHGSKGTKDGTNGKNKPFNKEQYIKYKTNQELNALIAKQVKKTMDAFQAEALTDDNNDQAEAAINNLEQVEVDDLEGFEALNLSSEEGEEGEIEDWVSV